MNPRNQTLGNPGPFENETYKDWSLTKHREAFLEALKKVRKLFPYEISLKIGADDVDTERKITSTNPNDTGEVVGRTASAGKKEAEQAIQAAKSAFPSWRDTDPESRAGYLFKAAAEARGKRSELAAIMVFEAGKSWIEADADVCEAIDFLEYYGREMIRLSAPRRMGDAPGEISRLVYQPRGVAAVFAPWNFPLAISVGMVSAAIVTGNTVIYKPSSNTVVTGSMVLRLFEHTGLPPGVLNYIPGPGDEIGDYLVTHPDVALIAFTGSKEVGLRIIELAGRTPDGAEQVKAVVAEMGGKNAIIVDDDVDPDEAVPHIIKSAFGYQGQKCSACSRLIVHQDNYEEITRRLKLAAEGIEVGPAENPKVMVGAVIDARAKDKIRRYIEIGKQEGTVLIERDVPRTRGHFVPITIFTGIKPEHRLAREEIFGPVLAVMKAKNFEEALDMANSTTYGLTGAVFSGNPGHLARARREFQVGNLYLNRGCTGALVERHPFGGFKMSGIGSKAGGPDYLHQFMLTKTVIENITG